MPITRRRLRLGPGAEFERPLFANVSSLQRAVSPGALIGSAVDLTLEDDTEQPLA
jgi:hypothetical protein